MKEENDEAPDFRLSTYRATLLDRIPIGKNINSFRLSCQDKDSIDSAMQFQMASRTIIVDLSSDMFQQQILIQPHPSTLAFLMTIIICTLVQ